jgi:2-oxoisovalerate dehydrogenase E1 component beta subunit
LLQRLASSGAKPIAHMLHPRGAATVAATASDASSTTTTTTIPMNVLTAVNDALLIAMRSDATCIVFGEDVAFGGVFRASQNLRREFGAHRVFNTPLTENGIAAFAIGK